MFRLDHHCPWWSGAPGGQGVTAAVEDRRSPVSGYGGEYSGPRPPHGAYAVTISNGLCDHTRAIRLARGGHEPCELWLGLQMRLWTTAYERELQPGSVPSR